MLIANIIGLLREESGQGMTEYGLVLGIIAVSIILVILQYRDSIFNLFQLRLNELTSAVEML